MGEIDNLNFKLILDDKDFNSTIENAQKQAQDLNVSLSTLLDLSKKVRKASEETRAARKEEAKAIKEEAKALKKSADDQTKATKTHLRLNRERIKSAKQISDLNTKIAKNESIAAKSAEQATSAALKNEDQRIKNARNQLKYEKELQDAKLRTLAIQKQINNSENGLKFDKLDLSGLEKAAHWAERIAAVSATKLATDILRITGEFEKQEIALKTITQDAKGAERLFKQIQDLAVESPYSVLDLTSYAKQLSAFSVPLDDLFDTTKMLADVAAGLGVSMDRIILAYGQVKAATYLRGQEVRQFTEAGIPILKQLAEQFSELEGRAVSTNEVFDKISKRQVPFEMVNEAFIRMTSQGGKFFNMQSVLADTLSGKLMKIKDQYQIVVNEIGKAGSGLLHGAADGVLNILRHYETWGKLVAGLVAGYGALKAVKIMGWGFQALQAIQHERVQLSLLKLETRELDKQIQRREMLNYIAGSNPYMKLASILLATITAVTTALVVFNKEQERAAEAASQITDNWVRETTTAKELYDVITDTTKSEEERKDALSTFNALYGQYLNNVVTDINDTQELALAYDQLTKSLKSAYLARLQNETIQPAQDKQADAANEVMKRVRKLIKMANLGSEASSDIQRIAAQQLAATNDAADKYVVIYRAFEARLEDMGNFVWKAEGQLEKLRGALAGYSNANDLLLSALNDFTNIKTGLESHDFSDLNKRETENKIKDIEAARKAILDSVGGDESKLTLLQKEQVEGMNDDLDSLADHLKSFNNEAVQSIAQQQARLKELNAEIKKYDDAEKNGTLTQSDKAERDELIKQADAIQKNIDAWNGRNGIVKKSGKTPQEIQIENETKALDGQLKKINAVNDAFKTLKSLNVFSDDEIRSMMKNMGFDGELVDKEYKNQILELADAYEKLGGDSNKQKAESLRDSVGKNAAQDFTEAYKAFEKYKEAVDKWMAKDLNLVGEGIAYKINKIATEASTKNNQVDLDMADLKKQLQTASKDTTGILKEKIIEKFGQQFWDEWVERGDEAIDELGMRMKVANNKKAQEAITALAQSVVSEKTSGLDMKDWGDKTMKQTKAIRNKLRKLLEDNTLLDGVDTELLEQLGLTTDDLEGKVKELLEQLFNNADDEAKKKAQEIVSAIVEGLSGIGDSLDTLGDATENALYSRLAVLGKALKSFSGVISDMIKEGEVSIATLVTLVAQAISDSISALAETANEIYDIKNSYFNFLNQLELSSYELDGADTMFGEDGMAKGLEIYNKLTKAANSYGDAVRSVDEWTKDYNKSLDIVSASVAEIALGLRSYDGTLAEVAKNTTSLADAIIMTQTEKKVLGVITWSKAEYQKLGDLIPDIFGEDGSLDVEKAKAFIETYDSLWDKGQNAKVKEQIEYLIEYQETIDDLEDAWDSYFNEIFGNLASDMTSKMIENFKSVGDAVYDLEEPFESLGETIVTSLLQSLIIDKILDKYEDEIKSIYRNYYDGNNTAEDVAEKVDEITSQIYDDAQSLGGYINTVLSAFSDRGLLGSSDSDSSGDTLSGSIKSITENTASLLASYVNAIRSDVSSMYMIQNENGTLQRDFFTAQVPTLADHLAQIQANTYNNAMNTQEILSELQSVMGMGDEGRALRVVS